MLDTGLRSWRAVLCVETRRLSVCLLSDLFFSILGCLHSTDSLELGSLTRHVHWIALLECQLGLDWILQSGLGIRTRSAHPGCLSTSSIRLDIYPCPTSESTLLTTPTQNSVASNAPSTLDPQTKTPLPNLPSNPPRNLEPPPRTRNQTKNQGRSRRRRRNNLRSTGSGQRQNRLPHLLDRVRRRGRRLRRRRGRPRRRGSLRIRRGWFESAAKGDGLGLIIPRSLLLLLARPPWSLRSPDSHGSPAPATHKADTKKTPSTIPGRCSFRSRSLISSRTLRSSILRSRVSM